MYERQVSASAAHSGFPTAGAVREGVERQRIDASLSLLGMRQRCGPLLVDRNNERTDSADSSARVDLTAA